MSREQMLIDGAWCAASSGDVREIINPANAEVIATVPEAGREDTQRAIMAARRAFDEGPWRETLSHERAKLLLKVADLIDRDQRELAELETLNTGKTVTESEADMENIAGVFRYYAALALTQGGELNPVPANALSQTTHEPIGVAAMITPWNYPLLQLAWKVAPALAAGCTFVAKPSELTPLTSLKLAELLEEAGLPEGVANFVLGAGAEVGAELAEHPDVDLISFTGGIVTGRKIAVAAAETVKRVALELGGKNPNIVLADANFDVAVDHALNAVFYHAGQVCSAGSRLLVQDEIHDAFVEAILERVAQIKLGVGQDADTEMGPLISEAHRAKVEGYIALAQEEGANLRIGGRRPQGEAFTQGFFLEPTVFTGVRADMRVSQEEIFGPVMTVERFKDAEEAVQLANATRTGLAAGLWSQDVAKAQRLAQQLRFGTVWINDFHPYFPEAPWGGFKESGNGRELGRIGLEEYLERKHIYLNLDVKAANWFGRSGGEQ